MASKEKKEPEQVFYHGKHSCMEQSDRNVEIDKAVYEDEAEDRTKAAKRSGKADN